MKGSETCPNDMQTYCDDFSALKTERNDDAEAAEGRFKAKVEANEKKAVQAAQAAAAAAQTAEELEKAPAAAAAAAKAAAAATAEVTIDDDTPTTGEGTATEGEVTLGAKARTPSSVAPPAIGKDNNADGSAEATGTPFPLALGTKRFSMCVSASFAWCVRVSQ